MSCAYHTPSIHPHWRRTALQPTLRLPVRSTARPLSSRGEVGDRRPCARVTSVGLLLELIKLQARLRGKTRGGAPYYQPPDLRFDPPRYAHTKRKCSSGHPSVVVSTDYSGRCLGGAPRTRTTGRRKPPGAGFDDRILSTRRDYDKNGPKASTFAIYDLHIQGNTRCTSPHRSTASPFSAPDVPQISSPPSDPPPPCVSAETPRRP